MENTEMLMLKKLNIVYILEHFGSKRKEKIIMVNEDVSIDKGKNTSGRGK